MNDPRGPAALARQTDSEAIDANALTRLIDALRGTACLLYTSDAADEMD